MLDGITALVPLASLVIVFLTFTSNRQKDHDVQRENNIKMNVKLDQLCRTTNAILAKADKQDEKIQRLERIVAVQGRDIELIMSRLGGKNDDGE